MFWSIFPNAGRWKTDIENVDMHRLSTQVRHKILLNSLLITKLSVFSWSQRENVRRAFPQYVLWCYPSHSPALWMEWLPPAVVSGWMGFAEDEDGCGTVVLKVDWMGLGWISGWGEGKSQVSLEINYRGGSSATFLRCMGQEETFRFKPRTNQPFSSQNPGLTWKTSSPPWGPEVLSSRVRYGVLRDFS